MNLLDLPNDILLNILEYNINDSIPMDNRSLLERITILDPSFSLGQVLSDMRKQQEDLLFVMKHPSWNLYNIFNRYDIKYIEFSEGSIFIDSVCRDDMKREIYDLLDVTISGDSHYTTTTNIVFKSNEDFVNIVGGLYSIYAVLYRIYDPLDITSLDCYQNQPVNNSVLNEIINRYDPPRFRELIQPCTDVDNRSNNAILHDIFILNPYYSLLSAFERAISMNTLRKRLRSSPYYPFWKQIKDYNWDIELNESRNEIFFSITIGDSVKLPKHIIIDKAKDNNEYTLISNDRAHYPTQYVT